MIERLTIDSSVLIAFFLSNDAFHEDSKRFFELAIDKNIKFIVPKIVLFESFHNLKKLSFFNLPNSHEEFIEFLNYDNFEHLDINLGFFNMFKQVDVFDNLKTSDAIIASCAFLTKSILISWDLKLNKNAHAAFTPQQFIKNLG